LIVKYRKRFLKELSSLPPKIRDRVEQFTFEELPNIDTLSEAGNIEKMQGYDG
jgi:mRNA-degrading endonuclease RelE of RelBE toxin-antitoxin system